MKAFLSSCLLFVAQGVLGDPGTSFLVTLPQAMVDKNPSCSLNVVPTNSSGEVEGDVTTLSTAPFVMDVHFTVKPGEDFSLAMANNKQIIPLGTLVSDMTMEITTKAEVTLVVVNLAGSNGDAYTAIPVNQLGTDYYAVAGKKMNEETASILTVSAPYDDTEVNVTLPKRRSNTDNGDKPFLLQGVTYFIDDVISVKLNRLQTLQLQTSLDLTGTRVTSSKPVSVLSGQNRTNLSGSGCSSHILEQMPPVVNWAKTFILVHLPNQTAGEYYRFIAKEPMTTVTIGGAGTGIEEGSGGGGGLLGDAGGPSQPGFAPDQDESSASENPTVAPAPDSDAGEETHVLKIQNAGEFAEFDLTAGKFMYVVADKPILVAQYTREQVRIGDTFLKDPGDPSLLVLSGLEHALDVYRFSIMAVPEKDLYVVLTARQQDVSLLRVNGQVLSSRNVSWDPVMGASDYVVGHVVLTQADMPCTLGFEGGPKFNAHVYYAGQCECWAMSLTHGQPQPQDPVSSCPTSSHSAGDGIDNDCDGSIDEEPCCVDLATDKDGDQYKNEDCASAAEKTCCTATGTVYTCEELTKSTTFTEITNFRRRAENITPLKARNKIGCGVSCVRMTGCWGVNYALKDTGGDNCELLMGRGMGLVAKAGWGFQSMLSLSTYKN